MNFVGRTRVPLGQWSVNVENGRGGGARKPTIPPSTKKDSTRSILPPPEQKTSSSSTPGRETASSATGGGEGGGDRAFSSQVSDAPRGAIQSASSTASLAANENSEGKGTGRKPLGTARQQNQQPARSKIPAVAEKPSPSSEPVTIVEHRRRPRGEGYTVHKYLRGRLLGKGGFARVYKITSLDTGKEYAVKIVPKANLVKAKARQKLQTEIKIHRTMKHVNICEYKHFFEDKANCYILLELCHNQSVNEMIKRRKSLTEEEVRLLLLQLVEAVAFMHGCNVIHRDLKLGNLFLSRNMNIKVGDFGLACRVDSTSEKRKTFCGTPNYIAPEVIGRNKEKRGHSFEVDVWSIGVICFTMIVGKPPYESKDVKSTYKRIVANEYSFPKGKVSEDARALISSMLQTDPKMRPSLEEVRSHPFFTLHQIPGSLPSTCKVSAPIWLTDEFGELYPIKPTSALDIRVKGAGSSKQPPAALPGEATAKRAGNGIMRSGSGANANNINKSGITKAALATSATGAFNISDDVNDAVECKLDSQLDSQSNAIAANAEAKQAIPADTLTEKMASCGIDDEVREMPPGLSASPGMTAPSVERGEVEQLTPPLEEASGPSKTPSSLTISQPSASNANDDLMELARMHDRLQECLVNYERIQNGEAKVGCPLKGGKVWGANRWVNRYVDYTSKYGLGFLLNDGSSGVYFNDSTKAVRAASGDTFVYVERRKTSSQGSVAQAPISAYTFTDYPEDLKKKVTLLQHFHSYLLDQQKRAEEAGEAKPLASNFEQRQDVHSSEDGTTSVSTVYMKKWINTKHAMLFRLSNGTVQVLFYDSTEVLVSSEGNLVTYVDKEKNRFVHSIAEVANKQRGDISRRLKYTKEIISHMILASKR